MIRKIHLLCFHFMSLSLEHLVDATDKSDFVIIRKEFKDKTGILITKRGYPYKYLDRNSTKQNDHPLGKFNSSLTNESILQNGYEHAEKF